MNSLRQLGNRDNVTNYNMPTCIVKNCELSSLERQSRNIVENMLSYVLSVCPETIEMMEFYNCLTPERMTNRDILREISWVSYSSGFRFNVIKKYWPQLKEAFSQFNVVEVATWSEDLEFHAERICQESGFNNLRKAKWCISNAQRIIELDSENEDIGGLIGYFSELGKRTIIEIVKMTPRIIQDLGFRGIGDTTVFHLMKNVGIDIFKPDIHVRRILARMGLVPSEDASSLEICEAMTFLSSNSRLKISELDTLLFAYGRITGDHVNKSLKLIRTT